MNKDMATNRRAFLKGSAIVAAPLAAIMPGVALADDDTRAKLARLEDERTIEGLHRQLLKKLNGAGDCADLPLAADAVELDTGLRAIAPDLHHDAVIAMADDGLSASSRLPCRVELECTFTGHSTVEQMARLQGHGSHCHTEDRVLLTAFAKGKDGWHITRTMLG